MYSDRILRKYKIDDGVTQNNIFFARKMKFPFTFHRRVFD